MDARIEVAEREHLDVLQQRRHRVGARQQRRHDDHRAGVVRNADRRSRDEAGGEAGSPRRSTRCASAIAMSAAGISRSSSERRRARRGGALRAGRTRRRPPAAAPS